MICRLRAGLGDQPMVMHKTSLHIKLAATLGRLESLRLLKMGPEDLPAACTFVPAMTKRDEQCLFLTELPISPM